MEQHHRAAAPASQTVSVAQIVDEIVVRFSTLRTEEVDAAIVECLQQIAEALGVERGSWWHVGPNSDDAMASHTWTLPEYRVIQSGESAHVQVPWLLARARLGEVVAFNDPADIPSAVDREGFRRFGTKSGVAVPFRRNGELSAILGFSAVREHYKWTPEVIDRLRLVAAVFGQALERKATDERLHAAMAELTELRDNLALAHVHLRR